MERKTRTKMRRTTWVKGDEERMNGMRRRKEGQGSTGGEDGK
jgi:hypothetical protein